MTFTNNNQTVTFEDVMEFRKNYNIFNLTLLGFPCVFNFLENDNLTFTIKNGIVYQEPKS